MISRFLNLLRKLTKAKTIVDWCNRHRQHRADFDSLPSDEEVIADIMAVPTHFSNVYLNSQSNTGICNMVIPATVGVTWNLTSLEVSMAGPTIGPNAKLTIYDGTVASGTVLFADFLSGPNQPGIPTGGSVGWVQKINIPVNAQNLPGLQAITGNAMSIQVIGTGANQVSINARVTDGLP